MMDGSIDLMSDDEVLALAHMMLPEAQQEELSDLLYEQSESLITEAGRIRLVELTEIYKDGLLRKSEAIVVAVQRGLMPRLG